MNQAPLPTQSARRFVYARYVCATCALRTGYRPYGMPVDWIHPIQCANRMKRKSEMESPTRVASDQTIRFVRPRSCIMK
jgi:hypothetical protein